jgi:hypothetical protein
LDRPANHRALICSCRFSFQNPRSIVHDGFHLRILAEKSDAISAFCFFSAARRSPPRSDPPYLPSFAPKDGYRALRSKPLLCDRVEAFYELMQGGSPRFADSSCSLHRIKQRPSKAFGQPTKHRQNRKTEAIGENPPVRSRFLRHFLVSLKIIGTLFLFSVTLEVA